MRINRHDTNGAKPLLGKGELGYDDYTTGGDTGRVFVGTGTENIAQAKKAEVVAVDGKVDTHIARSDNPHSVTKTQVGLGSVDNTSDIDKPISTAVQTALDTKQAVLVSGTNIKTIEGQSIVGSGNIDLSKSDVGLSNVDNTADSSKNVLSATKFTNARNIALTGDVDGNADLDGSTNISIDVTLDIDGATDIGINLSDTDLIIVDKGANGTNRKSAISRIWTYISGKLTGAISTVITSNLTASKVLVSDVSGKIVVSTTTITELGYVSGVTSAIQTQLNAKVETNGLTVTDNAVVRFDGITGLVQNSAITIDDSGNIGSGTQSFNGFGGSGFKNYIINGKKVINQRALTSTDNNYNQDRWYKAGNNWFQGIEGDNNLISGKKYTLSWVGTATASYYVGTATSSTINEQTFTPITKGGNFTLTISAGQNLWIKFASDSTGSTFNFVQLEEGSVATPFENRPYGLELSLCQRYYEIVFLSCFNNTNTASTVGTSTGYSVTKRVIPTLVINAGTVQRNYINGVSAYLAVNALSWFESEIKALAEL